MKLGTPAFQGARLRQARISLGLTQASLALMLGYKDSQVVSEFEQDKSSPQPEVFQRIVTLTGQPPSFFQRPLPEDQRGSPLLFRSLRSLDEIAKARAEISMLWLSEYIGYFQQFVELPSVNLPDFSDIPTEPRDITDQQIREIANRLRQHWKLGRAPLPDLLNLLEANGFVLHIEAFNSQKWDAVSRWDATTQTPLIVINRDNVKLLDGEKVSVFRFRFNVLHELFHLLFHRHADEALLGSKEYDRHLERQAHLFAGEMALPFDSFPADLYDMSLDALRVVKLKWGMSIAAMIHRLHDLGLTSDREDRNLWVNYSRRKWRTGEPLDEMNPVEHPTVLRRTVQLLTEHNVLAVEDLRSNGIFSEATQEQFLNMGEAFWRAPMPELKIHKLFG